MATLTAVRAWREIQEALRRSSFAGDRRLAEDVERYVRQAFGDMTPGRSIDRS